MRVGVWWGYLSERDDLEDLDVDGKITVKWIFKKWNWEMWTGFIWLRLGTSLAGLRRR